MRYPHASPTKKGTSRADEDRIRDDHQSEEGFKLPSLHLFGGHFVGNLGCELLGINPIPKNKKGKTLQKSQLSAYPMF